MGNGMICLCQTQLLPGSPCNQLSRHMQWIPLDFSKEYETMLHRISEEGEN